MTNKKFSNLEIMNLVKVCEAKYPVDTWLVEGIHIWPVIRNSLPYIFINHYAGKKNSLKKPNKGIVFLVNDVLICIFHLIKILLNVFFSKKCDQLLVGDGVSYTKINNVWVDRFCDPIVSASKKNKKFFLLEQTKNTKTSTLNNYECISSLEGISYYAARIFSFFKRQDSSLKSHEDFLILLQEHVPIDIFSQKELFITATKIKLCSIFFDFIIKRLGIKGSFIVCYYGTLGYALALSARKNNIELVDIEHGSIFNCPAYCGWSKVPENGYELLPHKFNLWHPILYDEFIASNHFDFIKSHRANVSGLSILDYVKKNTNVLNNNHLQILKKNYKHLILVTLQPQFFGFDDWGKLAEVVRKSPKDWGWIIRSHPAYKNLSGMEKILSIREDNITYDNAGLNLYEVLETVHCHVTTASASCLEAMMLNIPTLFISELAIEDFNILIQKKAAYYAATPEQIVERLHFLLGGSL